MKLVLVFLFLSSSLANVQVSEIDDERQVLTLEEIESINSAQSSWTAGPTWLTSMKMKDLKALLLQVDSELKFPEYDWTGEFDLTQLPVSFDASVQWPNCVAPVGNQGSCNAGYAFSVAASMSERYCIRSQKYTGVSFSAQYLMACGTISSGCTAGMPTQAWSFLSSEGTAVSSCQPWIGTGSSCSYVCANGTPATMYSVPASSIAQYSSTASIQAAIFTQGSVTSSMTVYNDLTSYTTGVYQRVSKTPVGGQSFKVFGWGVDAKAGNYWIVSNSWGTNWGMAGIAWIAFGQGLEFSAYAGMPPF